MFWWKNEKNINLSKTLLMSTYKICFCGEIRKKYQYFDGQEKVPTGNFEVGFKTY